MESHLSPFHDAIVSSPVIATHIVSCQDVSASVMAEKLSSAEVHLGMNTNSHSGNHDDIPYKESNAYYGSRIAQP